MSVIAFPNLAPQGPEASMSWELRSLTAINRSPLNAVATTLERPGAHWAVRMPYQNLATDRRARLQSFVSSARGHAQRFYVPVYGWTRRGAFPATELLTNNEFDSGTTGWAAGDTTWSIAAQDGRLRCTVIAPTPGIRPAVQGVSLTQYVPYVLRCINIAGRGSMNLGALVGSEFNTTGNQPYAVLGFVPTTTGSVNVGPYREAGTGPIAGDYFSLPWISCARCALGDNAPNALLQSDAIDDAAWTKTQSSITGSSAAPDGTSTADDLTESASAGVEHYVSQGVTVASAAADFSFSVALKASGRNFAALQIRENTGSTTLSQFFNVNGAAVGTSGSTGANWSNRRAFVQDLGGGWVRCTLVGRKTNAATSLTVFIVSASADGTSATSGGVLATIVWRATLAQSSVPTRLAQTTGAASSGTSQTGGALHLKGLPASTSGLLLQGDPAEIITGSTSQLVRTRSPLNSDAAGLGYFEFEPPLRISPSDNAAVIVHNPMCRMMMESNVNGWTDRLGGFADLEFAAVEDVSP